MSTETRTWLSTNTLIGFTEKRGTAWHHRAGDDNHYPDAIPVDVVQRRLFDWQAEERAVYVAAKPQHVPGMGIFADAPVEIPNQKAIVRSDTEQVLGIFKSGYQPHQYDEWLLRNVATILDADLGIGSAGLLRGGAVAWVSVEVPDAITTPEGVQFRPNLLAATSFDGSLSTTYKRVITNVVCDNTMAAALREDGQQVKYRHSAKSLDHIADAREALAIVHTAADDFAAEVARLTNMTVTDAQFEQLLGAVIAPTPPKGKTTRGETLATQKRDTIRRLWHDDPRVTPWSGTMFGVWQAVNTYRHHEQTVKGMSRQERNMLRAVEGTTEADDRKLFAGVFAGVA